MGVLLLLLRLLRLLLLRLLRGSRRGKTWLGRPAEKKEGLGSERETQKMVCAK